MNEFWSASLSALAVVLAWTIPFALMFFKKWGGKKPASKGADEPAEAELPKYETYKEFLDATFDSDVPIDEILRRCQSGVPKKSKKPAMAAEAPSTSPFLREILRAIIPDASVKPPSRTDHLYGGSAGTSVQDMSGIQSYPGGAGPKWPAHMTGGSGGSGTGGGIFVCTCPICENMKLGRR